MILPGLSRVSRLLPNIKDIPWRAVHVAGTNGKGSVCAYISSILNACGLTCGRFTSPHLIDRWDCISINERTIDFGLFKEIEDAIKHRDREAKIGASEFEILTATAFEAFTRAKVDVGVVEAGMGGRYDATNILAAPLVTVITKIGKDHEAYLGTTIEQIAHHKAGIMKPGSDCLIDGTNDPAAYKTIVRDALDSMPATLRSIDVSNRHDIWSLLRQTQFEDHQQMNILLGYEAANTVLARMADYFDKMAESDNNTTYWSDRLTRLDLQNGTMAEAIVKTSWPGRLQELSIKALTGRKELVLLDGAHNPQSVAALAGYVEKHQRQSLMPITWIIATTKGKALDEMLPQLLKPGDKLIAVEFGPVESMPWVEPTAAGDILKQAQICLDKDDFCTTSTNVQQALMIATETAKGGPIVIAGSLYLIGDILRLLRNHEELFV